MSREDAPPAGATKNEIRSWAREAREQLDTTGIGARITAHISSSALYRRSCHVLIYMALPGEVDLAGLTVDSQAQGKKTFYITRTDPATSSLSVHRLDPERLELHRFGFLQPFADAEPVDPAGIDLALVPGLAFDPSGTRLGFGRGLYDRLLSSLPVEAPKLGITPSELVLAQLPSEPHDVPMTHLATEHGVLQVSLAHD